MDVCPVHAAPAIAAVARRLKINVVLVPARLTWLLQLLDTHVFAQMKREKRRELWQAKASAAGGTITAAEQLQTPGILAGRYKVQWQVYLQEWDCWKSYSISHNTRIEAAWQAGVSELDVGDDESQRDSWNINLIDMLQRNISTGRSRPRRVREKGDERDRVALTCECSLPNISAGLLLECSRNQQLCDCSHGELKLCRSTGCALSCCVAPLPDWRDGRWRRHRRSGHSSGS